MKIVPEVKSQSNNKLITQSTSVHEKVKTVIVKFVSKLKHRICLNKMTQNITVQFRLNVEKTTINKSVSKHLKTFFQMRN